MKLIDTMQKFNRYTYPNHQDIKFRLLDDITSFIEESLASYNPQSIQKLKKSLEKFSESGVFIWKDITSYPDAIKKFQDLGLLRSEDINKLIQKNNGSYPNISLTFNGRKKGIVSFGEAVSDIYGVYIIALSESLSALNLQRGMVDVNVVNAILNSVKNFQAYIRDLQNYGLPVSGNPSQMKYPYNITDFISIESIIQLLPGKENFGLRYLPKEIGIQFIDIEKKELTTDGIRSQVTSEVTNVIKIDQPDRQQLFEGMSDTQKELINGYLGLSNTIAHDIDSRKLFRITLSDEKFLENSLTKYKNFMDTIPFDGKDPVVTGLITLMANFIDFFEAELYSLKNSEIDDSLRILFFSESLREFNTVLLRGILLHSTTYKKFIETKGAYFSQNIKQLLRQQKSKLFPQFSTSYQTGTQ